MSIRKIRIYPDPILRRKCRTIRRIDDDVRKLAADMVETLIDAEGVGLAANQVGALKRIIALNLPEEEPYWLVNPEIIRTEGQRAITEGCLSVPGYEGLVNRSVRVTARALDQAGSKWRVTAEELLAQALEHEIDHLNGIMYMDHLLEHEKLRKLGEEPAETETHLHDVNYEIHAHHHDDAPETHSHTTSEQDDSNVELLSAKAKLSEISAHHPLSELSYDLSARTLPQQPESQEKNIT